MKCVICGSAEGQNIKVDFPFFRHMDFAKVADKGEIFRCDKCYGLSYNSDNTDIEAIYKGDDYLINKKTPYVAFESSRPEVSLYKLRAEYILRKTGKKNPEILDVGCFDGKLLKELRRRSLNAKLSGFELYHKYARYFEPKEKIDFYHTSLSRIKGKFDLITIVYVINYIKNIPLFMKHLKRLLKKGGSIYIETFDIKKNPCPILYGDAYSYYNENLLKNLFGIYEFEFKACKAAWAPRTIRGIAKEKSKGTVLMRDQSIHKCLDYLDSLKKGAITLSGRKTVKVLGTSINASIVHNLIPERIKCFVDENPLKKDSTFNGLKVEHPKTLNKDDLLIVPYGSSSLRIKEKFNKLYPCEIVCF